MSRYPSIFGRMPHLGRSCLFVVVLGFVALGGCCHWPNLLGSGFDRDSDPAMDRSKLRKPEKGSDFSGASNKAREIESSLGYGEK